MLTAMRFAVAALPAFALAQSSSYQSYTLTVNSQVTTITLPPSVAPATTVTEVTSTAVATLTSTLSGAAPPAPTSQDGETIPITINGYITSIVLPYWASVPQPTAPLTVSTLPAAVVVLSNALSSEQSSAASVISSVVSAAASSTSSFASSAESAASSMTSSTPSGPIIVPIP
ncbi:MAG: hypothetical protein M1830_006550, partial [Pleopsidium flavum]